jgi:hypothetical protein
VGENINYIGTRKRHQNNSALGATNQGTSAPYEIIHFMFITLALVERKITFCDRHFIHHDSL